MNIDITSFFFNSEIAGDYYVVTKIGDKTKLDMLNLISEKLNLNLKVTYK